MTRRRLTLALALALALLGGGAACTHVLGVDAQMRDVVADMCTCNTAFGFLGTKQECEAYLPAQLAGITDGTRAAWLEAYAADCATCDTDLACFYEGPLCQKVSCSVSRECCSFYDGGGCDEDAGQCY